MKHDQQKKFISLDITAWTALVRQSGFSAGACYRMRDESLTLVIQSDSGAEEPNWPAVVSTNVNYTPNGRQDLPLGWFKPSFTAAQRKIWPKGAVFYFPVQDLWHNKFLFVVVDPPGRRRVVGDLDGGLEASARKIAFWLENDELSHFVSEVAFHEHIREIGADLRNALDHEIRTPLASITGYANLLTANGNSPEETAEFHRIIAEQAHLAVEAVNKISMSLVSPAVGGEVSLKSGDRKEAANHTVDIAVLLQQLSDRLKQSSADLIGADAAKRLKISLKITTDHKCRVDGSADMLGWAFWEVLKNAALHATSGLITINLYAADRHVVVDVQDDGQGIAPGAENLVFLRFYRDPAGQVQRRGKRGLGLGLFLARYLTEKHLGDLSYVRSRPGESMFRFVFPLSLKDQEKTDGAA